MGLALGVLLTGCVGVDPQPDFQRAAAEIADRLDVDAVYDPADEAVGLAKVQTLLEDGLTVDEAVQVALLNNRNLQALFAALGVSRADVVQSGLLSNPTLGLSLRFPEGGGRSNLTFGLAQDLVELWQIPVRRRLAEAQLEQVVRQLLQRAVDLAADVRSAAFELLGQERAQQIAEENLALAQRTVALTESRLHSGEVGQLDVNLARAHVIDAQRQRLQRARDRRVAEAQLARLLGLVRRTDGCHLADTLDGPTDGIVDDAQLIVHALADRFDIQAASAEVAAAEEELLRQAMNIFPSVSLGFELERTEKRTMPGRKILHDTAHASLGAGSLTAPTIQSRGERRLEKSQIIDALLGPTLQITLPIWDQNQAQIAKARFNVLRARQEAEDRQDAVAGEVLQAAANARTARQLVELFENEMLPLAEDNLAGAQRLYQDGEANIAVLIEAQESLIRERLAHVEALRDCGIAMAELARSVGGRLGSAENAATTVDPKRS